MLNDTQYYNKGRERALMNKWKPLLEASDEDLRPLTSRRKATMTAILMENQYNHMRQNPGIYGEVPELLTEEIGQAPMVGTGALQGSNFVDGAGNKGEQGVFTAYNNSTQGYLNKGNSVNPTNNDFYAPGDATLPNVIMPMIRRTFPELLANEIVGIQPMSGPVGLAFALRFRYDGENLADFSPDGGNTLNPAVSAKPWVETSKDKEAGYNYLNTAYSGITSDALTGNANFEFPDIDKGVARLLQDTEMKTDLPQMSMNIEKTAVAAGSRKLALKYSLELEQDLMNMHGISVDDEMTAMMSYEIQAEIDREILLRMLNIALNAGQGKGWSTWNPAESDGRWSAERTVTLWQAIRVQARLISLRNRRGAANFLVATPYVISVLETLPNFKYFEVNGAVKQEFGNSKAGTLGPLKVFVDTRTEAQYQSGLRPNDQRVDYILLGYKGSESWDSGLIYLPYIPVIVQRTMGPNDFSPRVGLSTRYAIAASLNGADNFYHVIILKALGETFDSTLTSKKFMW